MSYQELYSRSHNRQSTRSRSRFARYVVCFFLPPAIMFSAAFYYSYQHEAKTRRKLLEHREAQSLATRCYQIRADLNHIIADLLTVAEADEVRDALTQEIPGAKARASRQLVSLSENKQIYDQIRLINSRGMEIVRVDRKNDKTHVVPPADLQSKRHRYYFDDSLRLPEGHVFVSQLDLNVEHGEVEVPFRPMIRFGTPVVDTSGRKLGIAIINCDAKPLLRHVAPVANAEASSLPRVNRSLLNDDGYYLCNPAEELEWGFMLGHSKTFGRAFPDIWEIIKTKDHGVVRSTQGVFAFTTIDPVDPWSAFAAEVGHSESATTIVHRGKGYPWKLVSHVTPEMVAQESQSIHLTDLALYIAALLTSAVGAFIAATLFTRRKRAEEALGMTGFTIDQAPDGVFWVDPAGRFLAINETACTMLGYPREKMLQLSVSEIDPNVPPNEWDAVWMELRSKRTLALETQHRRADGSMLPVEITARYMEFGERGLICAFSRDISARKKNDEAIERSLRIDTALTQFAHQVMASDCIQEISFALLHQAKRLTDSHAGFVAYVDPEIGSLVSPTLPAPAESVLPNNSRDRVIGEIEGFWQEIHDCGDAILANHAPSDPLYKRLPDDYPVKRNLLCVPCLFDGALVGMICLADSQRDYTEEDLQLLQRLATFYSVVVQRQSDLQALLSSERRLELALEGTEAALWDWDLTTNEVYFSNQWADMLGCGPNELFQDYEHWLAAVYPEDKDFFVRTIQSAIDGTTPRIDLEHRIGTSQGEWLWVHVRGKVVGADLSGKPLRIVGTCVPIQSRKRVEEELRESNAMMVDVLQREKRISMQLEAAMEQLKAATEEAQTAARSKGEFLANMSHEIRTPMTAILGFAELLQQEVLCCGHCSNHDDCQHRLAGREHVETIVSNGRYLLNIINDILDISKIEAGKLLTERIRFSLPSMLQEVQSLMQVRSSAKGLDLRFEVDGKLPRFIENDPTRLKQVLLNLIGNAIKFTEAGSVRVIIRFNRRPLLEKDAASHGEIVFEIIDTGIGIGPEQLQNLFQPFNQADSSTTRRYGGTGLGLSISKRLATMLGGDIVVESRPGEGSVFTLSIDAGTAELGDWVTDLSADQDESKPVASPDETKRTNKPLDCRILLAEDGIDNQRLIKFILTKAGADVTIAENGKEAVNEVQRAAHENRRFDLVLMDMQMPVMDGYEATRHLRELGYAGTIVALTAHAMATDRDRCIDAGCDDFATKPIDRNALVSLVRGIVAKPVDSVL